MPNLDLNERERNLLIVAVVVIVPLFLYYGVFAPLNNFRDGFRKKIGRTERKIEKLSMLTQESRYLKGSEGNVPPLRGRVRNLVRRVDPNIRDINLKPALGEDGVQRLVLSLDQLSLKTVQNLIFQVENNHPVVRINKAEIARSYQNPKLLRLTLDLSNP